jgi:hypothetical protein
MLHAKQLASMLLTSFMYSCRVSTLLRTLLGHLQRCLQVDLPCSQRQQQQQPWCQPMLLQQ